MHSILTLAVGVTRCPFFCNLRIGTRAGALSSVSVLEALTRGLTSMVVLDGGMQENSAATPMMNAFLMGTGFQPAILIFSCPIVPNGLTFAIAGTAGATS
jgi:hypothetical protein